MSRIDTQITVRDLFDSLPPQEQERISSIIIGKASNRERERSALLEKPMKAKEILVQELEMIEQYIARNDEWFVSAQKTELKGSSLEIDDHTNKAKELYFRKKHIVDISLPEAELTINRVLEQIEIDEQEESVYQQQDLEILLRPIREDSERLRTIIATITDHRAAIRKKEYSDRKRIYDEECRKKCAEAIRYRVTGRKITHLVHFSPLGNLLSILKDGLLSRNALSGREFIPTDDVRIDNWLDWISTSVSFPNYKMLNLKRNSLKHVNKWVILLIRREALWELECKFFYKNAACSGIQITGNSDLSSVEAFEDMFGNSAARIDIPAFYTTDPQAEVMIRNIIPRHYIDRVVLEHARDTNLLNLQDDIHIEVCPKLFKYRSDYANWLRLPHIPPNSNMLF